MQIADVLLAASFTLASEHPFVFPSTLFEADLNIAVTHVADRPTVWQLDHLIGVPLVRRFLL